ncbi:hypothetical protein [Clostridium botulinum]|uniref:hypothetical protein n=1 Tax=Clostridium botulinum TaxID=1491 RepID=UPI0009477AE6|nr:hypothetical protein [Clostridium botulinum]APQ96853.1 putative f5/8 type C domain protein [Clostridium botulinum]MBN3363697.1 hypothetical protein [Clostridium botulinum]
MAILGESLLQPENGYKRIDDTNENISYKGNLYNYKNHCHTFKPAKDGAIQFNFIGKKLRILCETNTNGNYSSASINIDNKINEVFSTNYPRADSAMVYNMDNLADKEHHVTITALDSNYFIFDALDIDEVGIILPFDPEPVNYKFLVEQNNNYYSINNNYIDLGKINNDEELDNLINNYGYNDLSIITQELNNKKIPTKLENDYYKSFDINLNDIKYNINLIEEDDKKYIEYGCNNYKISDKIKEINNAKFEVLMKE